ncbi:MAG: YibE/F family protein [Nitriliruptor sp.]|nr:MAG: YibE/F family protein [Nitriliruptor sp.]
MASAGLLTYRRLLGVVAVLALAAVIGLVWLWPRGPVLPDDGAPPLEALVEGEIHEVTLIQGEPDEMIGISGELAQLEVDLLDGPDAGERISLEINTDGFPEFRVGDRVLLDRTIDVDGELRYFITDFQRLPTLFWLLALFVVTVLVISRWHGFRSLLGLGISLAIVVRFVVPAIIAGTSPPVVALVGAMAVMIVTLYLAHGVNEMTTSAIVGTAAALVLTVLLGMFFIDRARITGFASDDAVFARFAVEGLDLQGLVLAGLIIAALGVLDDVTISQASTVFALHDTNRQLTWTELFARAMKVGRDHIASVVNTLFLAYTGASIALLLLFYSGGVSGLEIVNSEVLAEEIVKTVVGSLGLIAAVPFTTALAASVAVGRPPDAPPLGVGHHHGPVVPVGRLPAPDADAGRGEGDRGSQRPDRDAPDDR